MINLAISSNFSQTEKLLNFIFQSNLEINKIYILEISHEFSEDEREKFQFFGNEEIEFVPIKDVNWDDIHYYIYNDSLTNLTVLTLAVSKGVFAIDISGKTAVLDNVAVVIPGIDEGDLSQAKEDKMIALPDMQVCQLLLPIKSLIEKQTDLFVSITNLLPVSYNDNELGMVDTLVQETRNMLNLTPDNNDKKIAYNIQSNNKLKLDASVNIEGQIKKMLMNISFINLHSLIVPIFYGVTQQVSINLNSLNHWEQEIIDNWIVSLKNNENIYYSEEYLSPRDFLSLDVEEDQGNKYLSVSEITNLGNTISYKSVSDVSYLQAKLTVDLLTLLLN